MLEKVGHVILLKDFYGALLTEKQQDVINLYYENDLSLSEIADNLNITRQAVHDLLKRAESALEDYECRLGLVKKFLNTRQQLEEVYRILNDEAQIKEETLAEAVRMLRSITESI
ncbi:MAG: YlxM family DNA-binding protein [Syntrophomonadaceae bacterium]|nr:YlxM family DNA-binding protein [Syntrophomonadaceae bacterium]